MDYGEALGVFYATRPPDTPVPEAVSAAGPARRLRDAVEQLDRWSGSCIGAGCFPPDPLKRAAG